MDQFFLIGFKAFTLHSDVNTNVYNLFISLIEVDRILIDSGIDVLSFLTKDQQEMF